MTKLIEEETGRTIDIDAGRRAFMRNVGLATAGAAVLGVAGMPEEAQAAVTDADILNFALNLEYLEAEFYLRAAYGTGLTPGEVGGAAAGPVAQAVAGQRVRFTSAAVNEYATEIANDERNHVRFLRSALGGAAVPRPAINLASSFTAAATAAGLIKQGQSFNPFANETNFLLGAFIFEDVGVTAYKGASPLIANKTYLEAAAGILAVEAYHAGIIRLLLFQRGLVAAAQGISNARDNLDNPPATDDDQGITEIDPSSPRRGRANLVPTDGNSIAFSRTTNQVLRIVYLGANNSPVSFFPNRVNGTIQLTP